MLEKIYQSAPHCIQNLMLTTKGYAINRQRYSKFFEIALAELINNEFSTVEALREYQNIKFEMLLYNVKKNPLSMKRFTSLYGDISKYKTIDDINSLPILSKSKVKEVLFDYPGKKTSRNIICHTSGTTGSGMIFPVSKCADAYQWATWWRYRNKHGIDFNSPCGYFGGRSIVPRNERSCFYRINRASRQLMFSAYHLNLSTVKYYIQGLQAHQVKWIHGYPSILANLASLCLESEIDIKNQICVITIGAESLLPQQKLLIEAVFDCPIRQHYGLSEGVANISEDRSGNLVVDEDFSICEFIHLPNGKQKLLGSSLYNFDLPLLRYDTGDEVTLEKNNSGIFRQVTEIDGRKEDFIVLSDGTKIGRLDHIFKDIIDVKEVQIRQNTINEIEVLIVKANTYTSKVEKQIRDEFDERLAGRLAINIKYIKEIPKTNSGKLRFVVSTVIED